MQISLEALKEAISIKEKIEALEARLEKLFGGVVSTVVEHAPLLQIKKGRRKMSASARAKIAAAQRARWAKSKGSAPASVVKPAPATRFSAAHRAALSAAAKARHAKAKGLSVAKSAKKTGGISAEGRARLAAVMKARWAKRKKSGGPALNAPKKKK